MDDDLRRRSEGILRYSGELDRRVAAACMDGIDGLLTVSQHVANALQVIERQDLDAAVRELRGLVERLVRIDSELHRLRALKTRLGGDDGPLGIGGDED